MKNTTPPNPVLLVDDEEQFLTSAQLTLASEGITNTQTCSDSTLVKDLLSRQTYEAIVMDINMPVISGTELLDFITENYPQIPVIMVTAIDEVKTAVQCIKKGAYNYVVKPVESEQFVFEIKRAVEYSLLKSQTENITQHMMHSSISKPENFNTIITQNSTMVSIFKYVEAIGKSPFPTLITGETGCGKELLAEAVHKCSERQGKFIAVNVAGLDDTLFSDTLFGHKKGAYTGADSDRKGLIEEAMNGTLFLDEIGDLGDVAQLKLLRLLQEGDYYPLGSDTPKKSQVRIVVATNKDLIKSQENNSFRRDLYYRLKTHLIQLPPLRNRKDDLSGLVEKFVIDSSSILGKTPPTIPLEIIDYLKFYDFPGNIRELQSIIFDAVSNHQSGVMSLETIKRTIDYHPNKSEEKINLNSSNASFFENDNLPTIKHATKILIAEAMKKAEGNQTIASKMLGISRQALNQRLKTMKTFAD